MLDAPAMPDTASLTLIKRFTYKGNNEEWSNTYHFTGATPATPAAWKTLADAWIAAERTVLPNSCAYVRAYGYAPGNEHSVAQIDYVALGGALVLGSYSAAGNPQAPGDSAFMIRGLVGLSTTGKKVYVRKYFHAAICTPGNGDTLVAGQKTASDAYCATLIAGTLPGAAKWSGPQGADVTGPVTLPFLTTRTLKRRGKRPS